MKQPEVCEIRCQVRRGLFDDEWIVRFKVVDPGGAIKEAQAFAYGDSVLMDTKPPPRQEVAGRLRAYCLERLADRAAVVLPQPTLENGPSVVVPEDQLVNCRANRGPA